MKMINLNSFTKVGFFLYIIIYLISPNLAKPQNIKVDIRQNLENALNARNFKFLRDNFKEEKESLIIQKKFSKIIKEFPDSKWQIKRISGNKSNKKNIFDIKVVGKKIINGETYLLESNFKYLFSTLNNRIYEGNIKNLFTTVRNDNKQIDITFNIPDQVLTGTKYDIDIILDKPLEEVIIAGGIKPHQVDSFFAQDITILPLVSGGIFKITRAPSKPGTQIWSGIIAHPKGIITFTKSIEIVEII